MTSGPNCIHNHGIVAGKGVEAVKISASGCWSRTHWHSSWWIPSAKNFWAAAGNYHCILIVLIWPYLPPFSVQRYRVACRRSMLYSAMTPSPASVWSSVCPGQCSLHGDEYCPYGSMTISGDYDLMVMSGSYSQKVVDLGWTKPSGPQWCSGFSSRGNPSVSVSVRWMP
jgi:hypothetical protein